MPGPWAGRPEIANPDFPDLTFNKPFASPGGTVVISMPTVFSSAEDRRTPIVTQWMFNLQRTLGKDTVLELGYLGSTSHRLEYLTFQNKAIPAPFDCPGWHGVRIYGPTV